MVRLSHRHFGAYHHPARPGWIYLTQHATSPETRHPPEVGEIRSGLWLSRDRGESWQPFDDMPFFRVNRVDFDPDEPIIYVSTYGGGVWRGPAEPARRPPPGVG